MGFDVTYIHVTHSTIYVHTSVIYIEVSDMTFWHTVISSLS